MAEFPYPEYRNLWAGSALSKDRSMVTESGYVTAEQIEDGLRLTINSVPTSGYAPLDTVGSMRVPISPDTKYHWVTPVRNSGAVPLLARMASWVYGEDGGVENSGAVAALLQPGETAYLQLPNGIDSKANGHRLRWAMYYSTPDLSAQLPAGAVLDILDGITLVEGDTAPDFPFNGDEAKPVETLKRRNRATHPVGPSATDTAGWRISNSETLELVLDPVDGKPSLLALDPVGDGSVYVDPDDRFTPTVGQWLGFAADVKPTTASRAERMRLGIWSYSGAATGGGKNRQLEAVPMGEYTRLIAWAQVLGMPEGGYVRLLIWPNNEVDPGGFYFRNVSMSLMDTDAEAVSAVSTYFDGDTPASGNLSYRWAPDGTSLEVETIQPPAGRTTVWDGEPYKSTSTLWVGDSAHATGVFEVGISTEARLGIVSDIYSRSREKIQLKLAGVDDLVRSGHRIELAAAAMTSTPAVWHWRQVTGPTVALNVRENTCDFIAPDVERSTRIRIGVYAASEDGANRSDWHYFDLDVEPPMLRFRGGDDGDFSPRSPYLVGYSRGKREIWNDVIRPATYEKNPRHELEVVDLGIPDDDVVFDTEVPRRMAAGGVWVNPETGDVFRNFGAGYNETDDTTASPRTSTYWVNPASGDILEWIED